MKVLPVVALLSVLISLASAQQRVDVNRLDELTRVDAILGQVFEVMKRQESFIKEQEERISMQRLLIHDLKMRFESKEQQVDFMQKTVRSLVKLLMPDADTRANAMPKTCEEIRATDPASPSGDYWIDPDGTGAGDEPISVYCDMTTGTTTVKHDSQSRLQATACSGTGCYTHNVTYEASLRQMSVLIELSATCRQSVKVDCRSVPLEFSNTQYAWWTNRNGEPRYYWSGSFNDTYHTCQCGVDGNCVDPLTRCNCDALASEGLTDEGSITKKGDLPIMQISFGRTSSSSSYARHTLGPLECTGVSRLEKIPENCSELWQIGHFLNGYYTVKGEPHGIKSVYCDFSKTGDSDMETPTDDVLSPVMERVSQLEVGQANLTSPMSLGRMPESCDDLWSLGFRSAGFYPVRSGEKLLMVYCDQTVSAVAVIGNVNIKDTMNFYVKNPGAFESTSAEILSYDYDIVDHPSMSATTFTTPTAGTYQFHFHCQASTSEVDGTDVHKKTQVSLLVNDREVTFSYVDGYYWTRQSLSLTATVKLNVGDTVKTRLDFGSIHDTYFGGSLLEGTAAIPQQTWSAQAIQK